MTTLRRALSVCPLLILLALLTAGCSGVVDSQRILITSPTSQSLAPVRATIDTTLRNSGYKPHSPTDPTAIVFQGEKYTPTLTYTRPDRRFHLYERNPSGPFIVASASGYVPPFGWSIPKDFLETRTTLTEKLSHLPTTQVSEIPAY